MPASSALKGKAKKSKGKKSSPSSGKIEHPGEAPIGANGKPMIKISFSAAEKVPTDDYANVTVGPVTVSKWVEDCSDDELADHLNDLAQVVEVDCISVQRDLVLKTIQDED